MSRPQKLPSGKWRVRWIDEHGKRLGKTFKLQGDAKAWLYKELARVEDVKRGLQLPRPPDKTFEDLIAHWMSERASRKRNPGDDESIIRCHLRPAFATLRLRAIDTAHVSQFNAKLRKRGLARATERNIQTLLGAMLRQANTIGWLLRMPVVDKTSVRSLAASYRYLQTKEEIGRFLAAAKAQPDPMVLWLYKTAILTGMRAGELAGLKREDLDLRTRLITVQRSFAGPTKNGCVRHVPIVDDLYKVLGHLFEMTAPGRHIFTNAYGGPLRPNVRIFQERLHKVLEQADFPEETINGKKRRYIRFHDLRHTFASHWLMDGGDIFKLQRILGHKSMDMTQRYAHLAPNAFVGDYGRLSLS